MELDYYHPAYAAYYLDKVVSAQAIRLCCSNVHRLTAAAFLVTTKFVDDDTYSNEFYAQVFGLTLEDTNTVEKTFLQNLEYSLWDDGVQNLSHFLTELAL